MNMTDDAEIFVQVFLFLLIGSIWNKVPVR